MDELLLSFGIKLGGPNDVKCIERTSKCITQLQLSHAKDDGLYQSMREYIDVQLESFVSLIENQVQFLPLLPTKAPENFISTSVPPTKDFSHMHRMASGLIHQPLEIGTWDPQISPSRTIISTATTATPNYNLSSPWTPESAR